VALAPPVLRENDDLTRQKRTLAKPVPPGDEVRADVGVESIAGFTYEGVGGATAGNDCRRRRNAARTAPPTLSLSIGEGIEARAEAT